MTVNIMTGGIMTVDRMIVNIIIVNIKTGGFKIISISTFSSFFCLKVDRIVGYITFSIMTLSIITLSIMTLSITTQSNIKTLIIAAVNTMTTE
jgi:hypothetical protein